MVRTNRNGFEFRARSKKIALVITDCDGVLTDNGVYYSAEGEALKRFSIRDGMGVQRLRESGIQTAIVSGEHSPSLERRAEKLRIEQLYLGVRDKQAQLKRILAASNLKLCNIAYIGDDILDLPVIREVYGGGLTGAPSDAMPVVSWSVHYRCSAEGGHGAFREFAEWILSLRTFSETPEEVGAIASQNTIF